MFTLATLSDLIQISPQDFRKRSDQALEDNINKKYANRVLQQVGLCLCFWDMLKTTDGLISQGDGLVNVNVKFRLVVFRPFKGEIIQGVILDSSSPDGLRIGLDFYSDIWIPAANLFEGSRFHETPTERVWIWPQNQSPDPTTDSSLTAATNTEAESDFFYDKNEPVRLRVEAEVWHDITPQKPNFGNTVAEGEEEKPVPYSIIGSMQQPGLGPVLWWNGGEEDEDEDGEDEEDEETKGSGEELES